MIKRMIKKTKYLYQRVRYGFSDEDLWDFDIYLCRIISCGLRKLAKEHHGCPPELYDETVTENECHKWRAILEKIAIGFEVRLKIHGEGICTTKEYDAMQAQFRESLDLFHKYFENFWD